MSWTQVLGIVACRVLGYWLVAVFLPLLGKGREGYREPGWHADEPAPRDGAEGAAGTRAWYEVLGVRDDSSVEDITAAYRQKIREYHPDRVDGMGADIRALAQQRSAEINGAYAAAMRARGR